MHGETVKRMFIVFFVRLLIKIFFSPINMYLASYPCDLRTMHTDHTVEWPLLLLLFGIILGYARCCTAPRVRAAGLSHQGLWQ